MKILVIDDQEFIRVALADALRGDGCAPEMASNGKEAIARLRDAAFDCVITDLRMPGLDGRDVLKWVREHQPDVDVVLLTGHGDVKTAVDAMRDGAADFVVKETPFDPSQIAASLARVRQLRALRRENAALRVVAAGGGQDAFADGTSRAWQDLITLVKKIASSNAPVLIQGETGSGKELIARLLHGWSRRQAGPFLAVNCGTVSAALLESELFGHERGAFTGASEAKRGLLAAAEGGTLVLDEISEMSGPMQVALLRVLDRGEYRQVGGTRTLHADVRFLAASNRDLQDLVHAGKFRDDLLYRINTVPVRVPPLRERREDIPDLAEYFLKRLAPPGQSPRPLATDAVASLLAYRWPGNVRELRNVIERLLLLSPEAGGVITATELAPLLDARSVRPAAETLGSLDDAERAHIAKILEHHQGNKTQAARTLGIDYKTLLAKIKKYDLPS
ncbi:MAG TPA: sigma-54 dependent transcriptional regulator [Nitrospirales bacterium]|nr:sigma-54 dependent transcriptional regulator [Nitrospirales bacterium]